MTGPPSIFGLQQFFPTAPRVQEATTSSRLAAKPAGYDHSVVDGASSSDADAKGLTLPTHGSSHVGAPHPWNNGNDTPPSRRSGAAKPDAVQASTTTSTSSSSSRSNTAVTPSNHSTASTPYAENSPSHTRVTTCSGADMTRLPTSENATISSSTPPADRAISASQSHKTQIAEIIPARYPTPSVRGRICTFDPILDRQRSKTMSKHSKPIYKEFGLVCTNMHLSLQGGHHLQLLVKFS